jgi:hypothetical protein
MTMRCMSPPRAQSNAAFPTQRVRQLRLLCGFRGCPVICLKAVPLRAYEGCCVSHVKSKVR